MTKSKNARTKVNELKKSVEFSKTKMEEEFQEKQENVGYPDDRSNEIYE